MVFDAESIPSHNNSFTKWQTIAFHETRFEQSFLAISELVELKPTVNMVWPYTLRCRISTMHSFKVHIHSIWVALLMMRKLHKNCFTYHKCRIPPEFPSLLSPLVRSHTDTNQEETWRKYHPAQKQVLTRKSCYQTVLKTWTQLVIVKEQSSHLVYLNIRIQ